MSNANALCAQCRKLFTCERSTARFCSIRCRVAHHRASKRPPAQKAPRKLNGGAALLDTRTAAELWLAGISHVPREQAWKRAAKGERRRIRVRFADGIERITSSRLADDQLALADAITGARSIEMTVRSRPTGPDWLRQYLAGSDGDWITVPKHRKHGGWQALLRGVIELPTVVGAEFIEHFEPCQHEISRTIAVQLEAKGLLRERDERAA